MDNDTQNSNADDEFQAAFQEAAAARAGGAAAFGDSQTDPVAESPAPAAESSAEADPAAAPAPAADAQPLSLEDQLKEMKARVEQAEHRERSASQRIPAFQRRLQEAQQELDRLKAAATSAAPSPDPSPSSDDEVDALNEVPELKQAVDRLVAQRVNEAVNRVEQRVGAVERGVAPLHDSAQKLALQEELKVVEKEFPDWRNTVYTPEWDDWVKAQPPSIQAAYGQAKTGADALAFLRMHQRDKAATNASAPASAYAPTPAPAAGRSSDQQARLLKAVGPASRPSAAPVGGLPAADDFDANFKFFAARRQRAA